MNKLTPDSKLFHDMLFIMWELAGYYQRTGEYTVPDKASDLQAVIEEENTLTKITYSFPRIEHPDLTENTCTEQFRENFNYHLIYDLLPNSGIPKYRADSGKYDVAEAFFVESVSFGKKDFTVTLVYVDNPLAYTTIHPEPII